MKLPWLRFLEFSACIGQGCKTLREGHRRYLEHLRRAPQIMYVLHRDDIKEWELPPLDHSMSYASQQTGEEIAYGGCSCRSLSHCGYGS